MKKLYPFQWLSIIILFINSPALADNPDPSNITATITYYQAPRNLQFFARDAQDSGAVIFSGKLSSPGHDSMYVEVYKNNLLTGRKSVKLNYVSGSSNFSLAPKIHAELSEYKFKLYLKAGITGTLQQTVDSVICGDTYIICGQSNSHPTDALATYSNEYCRSFGIQTDSYNSSNYNPADTNWGISKADGAISYWAGPYNVGVWGLYLQKYIKDSTGIPTCVINGGRGSSTIEMQLRNNLLQTDLTSIYGKTLYRVQKAGLANSIKGIFWYQGESSGSITWTNYENNFQTLYNSWKENYPNFKKIFLFQTRPCCSEEYASQLREVQRTLPKRFSDIELLATAGAPYYEGCHYDYNGYIEISKMVFRPFAKFFYSTKDTINMRPPNIRAAFFSNILRTQICLLFDNSNVAAWPADTLGQSMKNYFYLNGISGNILSGSVSGDTVKLNLLIPGLLTTKVTYLPTVWTHIDSVVYEGPFMRNSRKIGALSFHDFPVSATPPTTLNLTTIIDGFYNQQMNKLNIKDSVFVYLRNRLYPYAIVDSAKAEIDSLSFSGLFQFNGLSTGTYYIVVKGRNSLETWSKSGGALFTAGSTVNYNFTTSSSQAYGNNLVLRGTKYCMYSSDLNQDGRIDMEDNISTYNDANDFLQGYFNTDLNGDYIVDYTDLNISYVTSTLFISRKTP